MEELKRFFNSEEWKRIPRQERLDLLSGLINDCARAGQQLPPDILILGLAIMAVMPEDHSK